MDGIKALCFLWVVLFFSCTKEIPNLDRTVISVADAVGTGEILNLSDYAKSVKYVPLETNDSVLIGHIEELVYEDGEVFLFDFQTRQCKQFNKDGDFMTVIGSIGQGPGEYAFIRALSFIPETKEVFLSTNQGYFIYGCENESYTYIPRIDIIDTYWDATTLAITNTLFLSQIVSPKDRRYHALLWGEKGNDEIYKLKSNSAGFTFHLEPKSYTISTNRWRFQDQIRCYWPETDTIYTVSDDLEFTKAFVIDLGKYKQSVEYILGAGREYEKKGCIGVLRNGYVESLNYLFLSFNFGELAPERFSHEVTDLRTKKKKIVDVNSVYGLFCKQTGELTLLNQPVRHKYLGFRNDLDGGPCFWPKYISSNDEMVTWWSAEDFLKIYEQLPDPSAELKTVAEKLTPDDNPVLMVVKLK